MDEHANECDDDRAKVTMDPHPLAGGNSSIPNAHRLVHCGSTPPPLICLTIALSLAQRLVQCSSASHTTSSHLPPHSPLIGSQTGPRRLHIAPDLLSSASPWLSHWHRQVHCGSTSHTTSHLPHHGPLIGPQTGPPRLHITHQLLSSASPRPFHHCVRNHGGLDPADPDNV